MSIVTFVRDYIQDPDRIISFPNFILSACKEFFWYIFSFQWFRNLTYVSLSFPNNRNESDLIKNILPPTSTQDFQVDWDTSSMFPINLVSSTMQNFSLLKDNINTSFESSSNLSDQLSSTTFSQSLFYGFFNGISSSFHFCAVTILIIHVLLYESKTRALRIAFSSCLGDISYMVAILFGFRGLIIPWLALEPLSYLLGFAIQFFFALEIIKDNRRVKADSNKVRLLDRNTNSQKNQKNLGLKSGMQRSGSILANPFESGQLSYNVWIVPSLILFSWCEQTQFFQTGGIFSLQPTASLLEMPGILSIGSAFNQNGLSFIRELQIFTYLLSFLITRGIFTWFCLSILQGLIDWKNNNLTFGITSRNSRNFWGDSGFINSIKQFPKILWVLPTKFQQIKDKRFLWAQNDLSQILSTWFVEINNFINRISIVRTIRSWFIPKTLQNNIYRDKSIFTGKSKVAYSKNQNFQELPNSSGLQRQTVQNMLGDKLAIAAVTCSLAFLPAYSTNLLMIKPTGFFPEENRVKHSFFSPWDMPATVLASDMDFISNHPNLAEYPFFLPYYDKGEYGGWLGISEEDIRYGPFRLWQSRRIRAPWRRTTLQEPALTFVKDKSLFINPLSAAGSTPNLKEIFPPSKPLEQDSTANIKSGTLLLPSDHPSTSTNIGNIMNLGGLETSLRILALPKYFWEGDTPLFEEKIQREGRENGMQNNLRFLSRSESTKIEQDNTKKMSAFPKSKKFSYSQDKQDKLWGSTTNFVDKTNNQNLTDVFHKYGFQKWEYLWKQFKAQSAYVKLLGLHHMKYFTLPVNFDQESHNRLSFPSKIILGNSETEGSAKLNKSRDSGILGSKSFGSLGNTTTNDSTIRNQDNFQAKKSTITKLGKKKLIEIFKKPLRKEKTSNSSLTSLQKNNNSKSLFIQRDKIYLENKIKLNKQILKRFKKFKKKLRVFRTRAYRKRHTKIKRLKHFHYLRNKKKKRLRSRRLLYKVRRQYPYIRNIKGRKAETFGFYSSNSGFSDKIRDVSTLSSKANNSTYIKAQNGILNFSPMPFLEPEFEKFNKIFLKEKVSYPAEYPKNKYLTNGKQDFHLIFRTQMGERLDFAQEEIRARIFMNPYIRFLLNNRIDNFLNRSSSKQNETSNKFWIQPKLKKSKTVFGKPKSISDFEDKINKIHSEKDLFKRRLIISKYADAVDFLKPSISHSYVDKVYNHQFKGTLSTARRLFSLKIQYDQALIHNSTYKSAIKHEGLISTPNLSWNNVKFETLPLAQSQNIFGDVLKMHGKERVLKEDQDKADPALSNLSEISSNSKQEGLKTLQNLLEKTYSAPLYASWDPPSRKLILTNRYLDYKRTTVLANNNNSFKAPNDKMDKRVLGENSKPTFEIERSQVNDGPEKSTLFKGDAFEGKKLIQFTHWPLKESYYKDNEFLVSQLYSNSQPIDSFLSQENEKARPVALPRRVNSFNTILDYKQKVQPTNAQRSQQFLNIESNDKKTFLFKHLWNSSNTTSELSKPLSSTPTSNKELKPPFVTAQNSKINLGLLNPTYSKKESLQSQNLFGRENTRSKNFSIKTQIPTSVEARNGTRINEIEYPLWMVLRVLPPNQGGFLWPGD